MENRMPSIPASKKDPKIKSPIPTIWRIRNNKTGEYFRFGQYSYWTRAGKLILSEVALMKAVEFLKKRAEDLDACEVVPYEYNEKAVIPVENFGE